MPLRCHGTLIGAAARRIMGWQESDSTREGFVLDALEQAVLGRCPVRWAGFGHPSSRGSTCPSIRYTERLSKVAFESSVGNSGDNCIDAMAETVSGLDRAEVTHRRRLWIDGEAIGASFEWVGRFRNSCLRGTIGNIAPNQAATIVIADPARFRRMGRQRAPQAAFVPPADEGAASHPRKPTLHAMPNLRALHAISANGARKHRRIA